MTETTVEELTHDLNGLLEAAQRERILISREGKPVALLIGIENKDEEDWALQASPEFWKMIEERRQEVGIPLEGAESRLFADEEQ